MPVSPGRGNVSTVLLPSASITTMPFEGPYQTPVHRLGGDGLNLRDPPDRLSPSEMSRATNIDMRGDGELQARWGQSEIATSGGTKVHSLARLSDPRSDTATRLWGVDTSLFIGFDGPLTSIDTGYSGDPLTLVQLRPDHGGDSWMYVSDRSRMRKVRNDGLNLPIGLPAGNLISTALGNVVTTQVIHFGPVDSSEAANWGAPVFIGAQESWLAEIEDDVLDGKVGQAIIFRLRWGGGGGYSPDGVTPGTGSANNRNPIVFWPLTRSLNLNTIGPAALEATDEDLFQIFMRVNFSISSVRRKDEPGLIANQLEELRIYVVTGDPGTFDPTVLPGSTPNQTVNRDSYVKAIRHTELTLTFTGYETWSAAHILETDLLSGIDYIERTSRGRESSTAASRTDPPQLSPLEQPMAINEWKQFGATGRPFRRGAFFEIGEPDWSKVIGIFIYQKFHTLGFGEYEMSLDDFRLIGGRGLDTAEPTSIPYDVRVTNFDPRTGTEGNPSDEQDEDDQLEPLRNSIIVTPTAFGDADMRQRIYVRGGLNFVTWFRAGTNSADGATFIINDTDITLRARSPIEFDHDEPVTSTDSDGEALRAQPARIILPLGDLLLAFGERVRPGFLYWSGVGRFGHWPPQNTLEVCPPGEELMGGVAWGGQAYIFSRKRLYIAYQNLTSLGTVITTNTPCHRGLHSPWAITIGEKGIYAVDTDGIFRTQGQLPTEIAEKLYPLFHREARNGYNPINMSRAEEMRLVAMDGRIFFQYEEETTGDTKVAVFDERRDRWLGIWDFARQPGTLAVENHESAALNQVRMYVGGKTTGDGYALSEAAFSDDGVAIAGLVRTGMWDGNLQRENKQLGDAIIDVDAALTDINLIFRMDLDTVQNAALTIPSTNDGRRRFIVDAFGTVPQFTSTASLELNWSSATRRPRLYEWGIGFIPIPEETNRRATQYDDLGSANEKYSTGVMIECDTFDVVKPFVIDFDLGGTIQQVANITPAGGQVSPRSSVRSDGRHRFFFSWPRVKANLIRLRPVDACIPWILYKLEWAADPEPARVADIDSNFEEHFDTYYTGLDIVLDTFGLEKRIELFVDGARLTHPTTAEAFWRVTTTGKQVTHLSTTPSFGHIYRYVAIDDNPCLDYSHRWFLQQQPSEQTNWNQGFTVGGTRADKWMKGVVLEIDTFGVQKAVRVEVDGGLVESFNVTVSGRRVIQHTFAAQVRGRVMRVFSIDNIASRLWPPPQIIFDEEPLALRRWETQELTFGIAGWHVLQMAEIAYRATAAVDIIVTTQIGDTGTLATDTYTAALPTTGDLKQKRPFFFTARKGVLTKVVLTSAADLYLYREESELHVQAWGKGGEGFQIVRPFGNDDIDTPMRQLVAKTTPDSDVPPTTPTVPAVPQAQ